MPASIRAAALELGRAPEVDVVFVSCTSLRLIDAVAGIEAALGKPVTSSNHALAWHCLRLAGVDDVRPAFGTLFSPGRLGQLRGGILSGCRPAPRAAVGCQRRNSQKGPRPPTTRGPRLSGPVVALLELAIEQRPPARVAPRARYATEKCLDSARPWRW